MSREEATASLGADPSEIERAREFGESEGLSVVEISPERRTIRVSGTVAQFESAFGVKLHTCESGSHRYLCYDGALSIPASLDGIIVAVLGLDQRPVARK